MFFSNFIAVGSQVIVLFILMAIGFLFGKIKYLSKKGIEDITNIVLYAVTPCVIINAFDRPFEKSILNGLLVAIIVAAFTHLFCVAAGKFIIKDSNIERNKVLRFGIVFSNCGYMSLPLQQAVLGYDGVFYAAAYIAVFNIILWTYGVRLMSGDKNSLKLKNIFLNPGIIGTLIGLVLFLLQINIPEIISLPIQYMASLNTPLPMIIIGYYISKIDLKSIKLGKYESSAICLRIIICPIVVMLLMNFAGFNGNILVSCVISASAPIATATTMFATKFGGDTELSSSLVAITTLLSILSMPVIIALAGCL